MAKIANRYTPSRPSPMLLLSCFCFSEFDIRTKSTVTQDDIDFNDNPPNGDFTMAITCTDGTTSISHNIIVDVTDTVSLPKDLHFTQ